MVARVTAVLSRFNTEWATPLHPAAILGAGEEAGDPAWRDSVLTPVTTIQLFRLQMLHNHTAGRHLPPLSGLRFSAAAYDQARARLPRRLFDLLLERFGSALRPCLSNEGQWYGHRTFLVEGSGCSRPNTPA